MAPLLLTRSSNNVSAPVGRAMSWQQERTDLRRLTEKRGAEAVEVPVA
jgi:hypothetical protein